TQDIKASFSSPYLKNNKKHRDCNACSYVLHFHFLFIYSEYSSKLQKKPVSFVNEATTLQHHQQAIHSVKYRKWAADNGFISMLPEDAKLRREIAHEVSASGKSELSRQALLDTHLVVKKQVIQYSDLALWDTLINWIIKTDQ
ncbi:hypothetical protein J3R82DRAFT_3238, partial [Butyriboletus roseoflavus]